MMRGQIFIFLNFGCVNASMNIKDALLNYIVSYIPFVGAGSLFMQNNTYPYMARWLLKLLEEVDIV